MLFRLFLFRLLPIAGLHMVKKRSKLKRALVFILILYVLGIVFLEYELWKENGWSGIALLLPALFPQYLFYGFAGWLLLRCILYAWSERVWNRIYILSILSVILGILTEKYWNPAVLTFFLNLLDFSGKLN